VIRNLGSKMHNCRWEPFTRHTVQYMRYKLAGHLAGDKGTSTYWWRVAIITGAGEPSNKQPTRCCFGCYFCTCHTDHFSRIVCRESLVNDYISCTCKLQGNPWCGWCERLCVRVGPDAALIAMYMPHRPFLENHMQRIACK
jgi:hypothetical protein